MVSQFKMLTKSREIGFALEDLAGLAKMRPSEITPNGGLPERLGVLSMRLRQLADQADAELRANEQESFIPAH